MSRFSTRPRRPKSIRVCLFVQADTYRRMQRRCAADKSNISKWFNEQAKRWLTDRAVGLVDRVGAE